jgi:hypothetical protein
MYSSEKFLSPIVTAGLPTPGPLVAGLITAIVAVVVLVLELLDDELLELPHAASARLTAHAVASAPTRIECALKLLNRLVINVASWANA